jgi:hypothetical protein
MIIFYILAYQELIAASTIVARRKKFAGVKPKNLDVARMLLTMYLSIINDDLTRLKKELLVDLMRKENDTQIIVAILSFQNEYVNF